MTMAATETTTFIPAIYNDAELQLWATDQKAEDKIYDTWSARQGADVRQYVPEAESTAKYQSRWRVFVSAAPPDAAHEAEIRHYTAEAESTAKYQSRWFVCVSAARPDATHEAEVTVRPFGNVLVVDFGEPLSEFPDEYQTTVNDLRENGRPVLADQLIEMLEDQEQDEAEINLVSLGEMARLLVEHRDFDDPSIGADRRGLVHAQWTIAGNGVLIWGFLEDKRILMVAQADESPMRPMASTSTSAYPQKGSWTLTDILFPAADDLASRRSNTGRRGSLSVLSTLSL